MTTSTSSHAAAQQNLVEEMTSEVSFAEIRQVIDHLSPLAPVVLPELPLDAKRLDWLSWLARSAGKIKTLNHMRVALFCASYNPRRISGDLSASTAEQVNQAAVDALKQSEHPVVKTLSPFDVDLQVYDLQSDQPCRDFLLEPALSESEAAHAIAYGMMAVEPGLDLLAIASISQGSATTLVALSEALAETNQPLETLAVYGGLDLCAMVGAILAARLARVPVLLDGKEAETAAQVLACFGSQTLAHCALAQALEGGVDYPGLTSALCIPRLKSLTALAS